MSRRFAFRLLVSSTIFLAPACSAGARGNAGEDDATTLEPGEEPGSFPSGEPSAEPGSSPSFATVAALLSRTCAASKCHGLKEEPSLKNDGLLGETLFSTIVADCGGVPLVTPSRPEESALLLLVERKCGELFMPDNCTSTPCLPPAALETFRAWIQAGAPR